MKSITIWSVEKVVEDDLDIDTKLWRNILSTCVGLRLFCFASLRSFCERDVGCDTFLKGICRLMWPTGTLPFRGHLPLYAIMVSLFIYLHTVVVLSNPNEMRDPGARIHVY